MQFGYHSRRRARPLVNAMHTYAFSTAGVVEVQTDEGITGWGAVTDPMLEGGARVVAEFVRALEPLLVGRDPLAHEARWADLWVPKILGRRGFETRVISGIDIALWDVKAKTAGLPLWRLLGAARDRVPVYVAGGYYYDADDHARLRDEVLGRLDEGFEAFKMKIGGRSTREDLARVEVAREALGDEGTLLVDANCAYRVPEARQMARGLEGFAIGWFEEPLPADDYEGYRVVTSASAVAIAAGENEYTRFGFRDLVTRGGVDILNADAQVAGGITEWCKIAALADAFGRAVAPHGNQWLHAQLVAAVPPGHLVEYYPALVDPLWFELLAHEPVLDSGTVVLPERPGCGLELTPEARTLLGLSCRPDRLTPTGGASSV